MFDEPHKTFMEILKVNNREVPFANLLAFFFRPNEKHGLKNFFIEALLNTKCSELTGNSSKFENNLLELNGFEFENTTNIIGENVKVIVEQKTTSEQNLSKSELNNKRIDILIVAENFVICIEFKINHDLNNPLQEYRKFVTEKYPDKRKYYVVLTPYRKVITGDAKNNEEFKQVILSHFVENVKQKLPENFKTNFTTNKYYDYFIDFIQTVENRKIKYERNIFFKELNQELTKDKKIISKFHTQKNGFLEIKKNNLKLKLRFFVNNSEIIEQNIGWKLENWSENKNDLIELISRKTEIKEIVEKITFRLFISDNNDLLLYF